MLFGYRSDGLPLLVPPRIIRGARFVDAVHGLALHEGDRLEAGKQRYR